MKLLDQVVQQLVRIGLADVETGPGGLDPEALGELGPAINQGRNCTLRRISSDSWRLAWARNEGSSFYSPIMIVAATFEKSVFELPIAEYS